MVRSYALENTPKDRAGLFALIAALATAWSIGCEVPAPVSAGGGGGGEPDGDTDTDTDSDSDIDTDSDSDIDTDSETEPAQECEDLPVAPVAIVEIEEVKTGSAMAFTWEGDLVTAIGQSLYRTKRGEPSALWIEESGCERGLEALPTGDIVCAGADVLYLFDGMTGTRRTAMGGLHEPGALAVGIKGGVYVAESLGGAIYEVNPYAGSSRLVSESVPSPNSLAVDSDRGVIYAISGCEEVLAVQIDGNAPPAPLLDPPISTGACLTDLALDACGNVYALTAGEQSVIRISPDSRTQEVYADFRDFSAVVLQRGPGTGGFRSDSLYAMCAEDELVELRTGVGVAEDAR